MRSPMFIKNKNKYGFFGPRYRAIVKEIAIVLTVSQSLDGLGGGIIIMIIIVIFITGL